METCCVVGATGYVGSHVTRELLKKGYRVRATCRDPARAEWLKALVPGAEVELHALKLTPEGFPADNPLERIVSGCKGVFLCAGYEKQELSTIDFMVNAATAVLSAACKNADATCVVLTSSTGSTNPPGAAADALKNEAEFWSDPEDQKSRGKFSPAAKTLMEINAFKFVGRNQKNEVVDRSAAEKAKNVRLCIMNPSWILGPQLQPGGISGNGLPWFAKIVKGEAMSEQIPNDSMSIIHVADLALLHIACVETEGASGRYFGVNRSWPWQEILKAIQRLHPAYKMPPKNYEAPNPVTRFNTARRDTLGVPLKDLDEIIGDTLSYLKHKDCLTG